MPKQLLIEKKATAVAMLCEGNSNRGVERMTGIHRDTIMRLGVRVGTGMRKVKDELFINLSTTGVGVDELWGFIGSKEKEAKKRKLVGKGDVLTWVALDADSKLVHSWHIVRHQQANSDIFIRDLAKRLVKRPQITSNAFKAYKNSIKDEFGSEVDYGSLVKVYKTQITRYCSIEHKFSMPEVENVKKELCRKTR